MVNWVGGRLMPVVTAFARDRATVRVASGAREMLAIGKSLKKGRAWEISA